MKQLHVIFTGRVQGVGFRFTVVRIAGGYDITGWVRNVPDGSVELIAEGTEEDLEQLLMRISESNLQRCIHDQKTTWGDARGEYASFGIRY